MTGTATKRDSQETCYLIQKHAKTDGRIFRKSESPGDKISRVNLANLSTYFYFARLMLRSVPMLTFVTN